MDNVTIGVGACVLTFLLGYAGMRLQKMAAGSAHDVRRSRHDRRGDGPDRLVARTGARHAGRLGLRLLRFAESQRRDHGGARDPARHGVQAIRPRSGAAAPGPAGGDERGLQGDLDREHGPAADTGSWVLSQNFEQLNEGAAQLQAKTPQQIAALPTINVSIGIIEQTRLLMSLQLASPISWPLLFVVISWAMLLFAGYGVMARLNGTAVIAALVGAFADRQRRVPDPGAQLAVQRTLPHPGLGDGAVARSPQQIAFTGPSHRTRRWGGCRRRWRAGWTWRTSPRSPRCPRRPRR